MDKGTRALLAFLLLFGLLSGGGIAVAQTDAPIVNPDTPLPVIGQKQGIDFEGDGVNSIINGVLTCATFGGPRYLSAGGKGVEPPTFFKTFFEWDAANQIWAPKAALPFDTNITYWPGLNKDELQDFWIYAFQMSNEDPIPGGQQTFFNNLQWPVQDETSGIPGGFPSAGPSLTLTPTEMGHYLSAVGAFSNGSGTQHPFFTLVLGPSLPLQFVYGSGDVLDPGEKSEICFYYSPFSPSNTNFTVTGKEGDTTRSITFDKHPVPMAQFFPFFDCETPATVINAEPGTDQPLSITINDMNTTIGPKNTARDPMAPNVFLCEIAGSPRLFDRVTVKITSDVGGSCVKFKKNSGDSPVETLVVNNVEVPREGPGDPVNPCGNVDFPFDFIAVIDPDYCSSCNLPTFTYQVSMVSEAPYDNATRGGLFEGQVHSGIDCDETDINEQGVSCSKDVNVGCPNLVCDFQPSNVPPICTGEPWSSNFTITVTNNGDAGTTVGELVFPVDSGGNPGLPSCISDVDLVSNGCGGAAAQDPVTKVWTISGITLAAGGHCDVTFKAAPGAAGSCQAFAKVSPSDLAAPQCFANFTVSAPGTLSCTVTGDCDPQAATFTMSLKVTNNGVCDTTADVLVPLDTCSGSSLPAGIDTITMDSACPAGATCTQLGSGVWQIQNMLVAAGATITLDFSGTLIAGFPDEIPFASKVTPLAPSTQAPFCCDNTLSCPTRKIPTLTELGLVLLILAMGAAMLFRKRIV